MAKKEKPKSLETMSNDELEQHKISLNKQLDKLKDGKAEMQAKILDNDQSQREVRKIIRDCESIMRGREENAVKYEAFEQYPHVKDDQKERVWSKAYEHGHSSGLHEVRNYFHDFMEIFN